MLFNKNNNGADELRNLLGFIDADTNFDKWKTWINLSVRQITTLTGENAFRKAEKRYASDEFSPDGDSPEDLLVCKFQLANALFAYVKLLPSLDAGHGNSGRRKMIGAEEKSLTALEAYKDETNILNLAYEALEDLINFMEEQKIDQWLNSSVRKLSSSLLIPNLATFNRYYTLNSSRMFFIMAPMIKEVQDSKVAAILTKARLGAVQQALQSEPPNDEQKVLIDLLENYIRRPMALAALALAFRRLPLELLPEGIVQTRIVGSVKEKTAAQSQELKSLIDALSDDANDGFAQLQEQMTILEGIAPRELYVEPPKAKDNIKGFLF